MKHARIFSAVAATICLATLAGCHDDAHTELPQNSSYNDNYSAASATTAPSGNSDVSTPSNDSYPNSTPSNDAAAPISK